MKDNWKITELFAAYERLYTPGTKTGVFYHIDMYNIAIQNHLKRIEPPKLLPERYMLEIRALFFVPHHFFFEAIDKKIQQLLEAGLIEYHLKSHYTLRSENAAKLRKHTESFKVLTLGELEAGFVVSLVPLIISAFVFCVECITAFDFSSLFNRFSKYFR